MFCKKDINTVTLNCATKWFCEIVSFCSVIFSSIVVIITMTRTKMNVINKLIVQILISEIIDGVNMLLVIFDDYQGPKIFENFNLKTYVCFSQIYLSIFTCFWTLSASFFISLRMYDIMVKRNQIFKNKIMEKYVSLFSIIIPAIFSYIIWIIQVYYQSNKFQKLEKGIYYQKEREHHHFRHMHCWVETSLTITLFIFAVILIGANVFFSIIKGSSFLSKVTEELKDKGKSSDDHSLQKKIDSMEHIRKTLWIYPITSGILWFIFYIIQIIVTTKQMSNSNSNNNSNSFISILLCIIISIRLIVYVIVFIYTQKDIKYQLIKFFLCQPAKKKIRTASAIMNDIEKEEGSGNLISDDESNKNK
jgi:hypothetical protein